VPVRSPVSMAVRCPVVKRAALTVAVAMTLVGCGSGDSTASKTPEPTDRSTTAPSTPEATASPPPRPSPTPTDPCKVNLAAPEIARAVAELPRDPRSNQPWSPEPVAGNYNECAQLSAVIIEANTNAENPNTRALMFHRGKFI